MVAGLVLCRVGIGSAEGAGNPGQIDYGILVVARSRVRIFPPTWFDCPSVAKWLPSLREKKNRRAGSHQSF